jgi:hypothetical protein
MPLYAHDLARLHLRSSQPASVTSTIEVGASANPHSTRCPTGAKLPATSCLGASRTPTASVRGASRHVGVRETYTQPDMISHGRCLEALGSLGAKHYLSLLGSRNREA